MATFRSNGRCIFDSILGLYSEGGDRLEELTQQWWEKMRHMRGELEAKSGLKNNRMYILDDGICISTTARPTVQDVVAV